MLSLFCKECNRKVLDRCSECGQFKPEFKHLPKDLCGGCGQLITVEQRAQSSDDEIDDEEEDFIEMKDGTWRRKCSCCNRPRNMCIKCKRPYVSDSEDESDDEDEESDLASDNDEDKDEEEEDEEDDELQRGSGSTQSEATTSKRLMME